MPVKRWTFPPLRSATPPDWPVHCWRLFNILRLAIYATVVGALLPENVMQSAARLTRLLYEPPRKRKRKPFPRFVLS